MATKRKTHQLLGNEYVFFSDHNSITTFAILVLSNEICTKATCLPSEKMGESLTFPHHKCHLMYYYDNFCPKGNPSPEIGVLAIVKLISQINFLANLPNHLKRNCPIYFIGLFTFILRNWEMRHWMSQFDYRFIVIARKSKNTQYHLLLRFK